MKNQLVKIGGYLRTPSKTINEAIDKHFKSNNGNYQFEHFLLFKGGALTYDCKKGPAVYALWIVAFILNNFPDIPYIMIGANSYDRQKINWIFRRVICKNVKRDFNIS